MTAPDDPMKQPGPSEGTPEHCVACGSPVQPVDEHRILCANKQCPAGRMFWRCGYCRAFTFAYHPEQLRCLRCFNGQCRLYMIDRSECATCGQISEILYREAKVCINRKCARNEETIATCGACGKDSVVLAGEVRLCTKSTCPNLMEPVAPCDRCGALAHSLDARACRNRKCDLHEVRVAACPSCDKRTLVTEVGDARAGRCVACGARSEIEATPEARDDPGHRSDTSLSPPTAEPPAHSRQRPRVVAPPRPKTVPPAFAPPPPEEAVPRFATGAHTQTDRELCGSCSYLSAVRFRGVLVCLNRECPGNASRLERCGACGHASVVAANGYKLCTKSTCAARMAPLGRCAACKTLGLSIEAGRCRNTACAVYDIPVSPCPSCEEQALVTDPTHPRAGACLGCGYEQAQATAPPAARLSAPRTPALPVPPAPPPAGIAPAIAPPSSDDRPARDDPPAAPPSDDSEPAPTGQQVARDREALLRLHQAEADAAPGEATILEAFTFVRDFVLADAGRQYPVILVIGLPGAGKTTYLTMLGEILRSRRTKYYFPYDGVDVRPLLIQELVERRARHTGLQPPSDVQRYRPRVRDLVYDFAREQYRSYLGNMLWSGATPREVEGGISSTFLVAELTRHRQTVAKIVTLETSGEDFEDVLRGIRRYDPAQETDNPLHRILYELLDLAEGFVVLVSPDRPDNDDVFHDLFLMVKTALWPRALNALSREVRQRLVAMNDAEAKDAGGADFLDMLRGLKREGELEAQQEAMHRAMAVRQAARLEEILARLERDGVGALTPADEEVLREVERDMERAFPEQVARVRNLVRKRGSPEELIVQYYKGLLPRILDAMPEIIRAREEARDPGRRAGGPPRADGRDPGRSAARGADIPPAIWRRILWEVRRAHGLPDDFVVAPEAVLAADEPVRRMRNLRHVSIVSTKSDMYPTVYPADAFPRRALPRCRQHLEETQAYLQLCGGSGVRYYNASATGYSILRDTLYYPGNENTLTPIHILEPTFDALHLEER